MTDFWDAIESGDARRAAELLALQPDLANSADVTPPPLHWAIYRDDNRMVELLLDHGADLERKDPDRDATPLDYAIVYGRTELIPVLVARGSDLTGRLRVARKGASGGFEEFPELPPRALYAEIVRLLEELGAQDEAGDSNAPA